MKTTSFDKTNLNSLRSDIDAALAEVAQKYGISIKAGNATYTGETATFKLNLGVIDGDGVAADPMIAAFKNNAKYCGLEASDLGRSFVLNGRSYTIHGLNLKARNRPIIARGSDGKLYSFEDTAVVRLLKAA
jgi:hypothetical protein